MNRFSKVVSSVFTSSVVGVFLFALCLFAFPQSHVSAVGAENWRFSSFGAEFDAADKGQVNSGAYVDRTFQGTLVAPSCQMWPIIHFCSDDPVKISRLQEGSVIGMTTKIIATTFTDPPAHTYAFIQDMGQTLGFIPKQAYAQGIGFGGLSPLLPLWKAFRNVAYSLLALVMIVIGFMVMLRKKIDPKTVVTVQNALPRIVITLLLITFSYAIVGIVIDLMYVIILIIVSLFQSTHLLQDPSWIQTVTGWNTTSQELYTTGNLFNNLTQIRITPWQILGIPLGTQSDWRQWVANTLGNNSITGWIAGPILAIGNPGNANLGEAALQSVGAGFGGLSMTLLYFIMCIAMIFLFVRLTILFVGAYIQIVIALLFGPIQILFEAVPGSNAFSSWLKNLVSNVSVFPVGATMFMLANVFATFANTSGQRLWTPPFMGVMNNVTSLSAIIGLGILFTIPTIAGQIKEALKAKPAVDAGPGAIMGPFTSGAGQLVQLGYQLKFLTAPGGHGGGMADTTPTGRMVKGAQDGPGLPK